MSTVANAIQAEQVKKSKTLLLVAILLGVLAAAMNYAATGRKSDLVVYKAKKQILAGTPATESLFERVTISGDLNQMRNLVVDVDDFAKAFKNRPVVDTIEPGQLLLLRSFDISGEDVRETIKPGQRALSIDVPDEAQAVAYFIRPGDAVDVWGWVNNTAQLLKEGACVRAVGEASGGAPAEREAGRRYRTITLVVSDADVRGLVSNLALAEDKVRLSMLGPCDPKAEKPAMKAIELMPPDRPSAPSARQAPSAAVPGDEPTADDAVPSAPEPVPTRKM
jgi:Flp pilus assembly protein CpaB